MTTSGARRLPDIAASLSALLPPAQVITDPLRRLAYGTDASFYRLVPEVVAVVEDEAQVQALLQAARAHGLPVTFRAAGTSLSGQAVTDGVLALIGEGFATCEVAADGATVRLGPGMVGADVNRRLAPFGRKIGPDPASIATCKIGGIAANNASGMCCGTALNSYQTLASMRVVLADGSVLDTADGASVAAFRRSHAGLLQALAAMAAATRADTALAERIRHKYRIKNTTGYSLNALVDFEDPVDILAHLMIGSEGTLGFISRITYRTVEDDPCKASALVFFPTLAQACQAVLDLRRLQVAAVELLDRASLRSVQDQPGMPPPMRTLGDDAAALLVELRAQTASALQLRIDGALAVLARSATVEPARFSTDPAECEAYWKVRKGTFPSVGAMRRTGTTVIIEDVAFPVEVLAPATLALQAAMRRHGYAEGIIFGHALEGNLHFVFTQDFSDEAEIARYAAFMEEVCTLVVDTYDGSLKAEHGTGRNMAPFVEREWGPQATGLMRELKALFDPDGLLNPGVILDDDPQAHLRHLKPMPAAETVVDRCIECGFCEPQCPSHRFTLSPRQRITSWRERARRQAAGEPTAELDAAFGPLALDSCAGCSLCSTACPVGIDTGNLVRLLRDRRASAPVRAAQRWTSQHFDGVARASRTGLRLGHLAAQVIGGDAVAKLSGGAWKRGMPTPARRVAATRATAGDPVVYFPTCGGRIFGDATPGEPSLHEVVTTLLTRAGYAVRLPQGVDGLCCGQMLYSKGRSAEADAMSATLLAALRAAADDGQGGHHPIVMDASACSARMKPLAEGLRVFDFHEFAHDALLPRLHLRRSSEPVALHVNCSVRRSASDTQLRELLRACTEHVVEPEGVGCCGFGGDLGFKLPALNAHALRHVAAQLPEGCCSGVSSNRTCEIGLTDRTGRPYRSIAYLLEERSRPEATC